MRRRGTAGVALTETAITLGFALMVIFGAIELALAGYVQLQLDGATFFVSHAFSAGSQGPALNTALQPLFPSVPMNLNPIGANPPNTNVAVNFTQWGATAQRYGGATVLRPQLIQTQASMTLATGGVFGGSIKLSSGNVDGRTMVGNGDDDASGADYNSANAFKNLEDPLKTDDQNTPPYFFDMGFIWDCKDAQPYGDPCSNRVLRSLGLAEYLKNDNYNTLAQGIDSNGTYNTMKCHQQYFAAIAKFIANDATQTDFKNDALAGVATAVVYSWDVEPVKGEALANAGQLYPLAVRNGCF
ncbi:MAG: pilus assembly protein [Candidatus Eremiobacteraeota bacterium]|nr:pilus assembly protein [Candidatus Eremiobacteraeota bacterium]